MGKSTLDEILPEVYADLHRLAANYMRNERDGHTLQPTALVHEAYMRLIGQHSVDFRNRGHLLGVAAQMMRRILRTHDERRDTDKRGGELTRVCLSDSNEPAGIPLVFSEVDEALKRLSLLDERQGSVVELRIFGGLSSGEIASYLNISVATAHRDWATGRLWMMQELTPTSNGVRPLAEKQ
jgi:RNA polymerase sigma-70 factor (ECF subfamily)